MSDDRFDEELNARLRAYEAHLPDDEPPNVHPASRPGRWLPLAAAAAVVVLVGGGLALATRSPIGQPSPTSSVGPSASPRASFVPTTVASPTVSPTPTPAVTPAPASPPAAGELPASWTRTAEFVEEGRRYLAGGLAAWDGALVAVGTRYETDERGVFGPPPAHAGRVWRSDDGEAWGDVTPTGTFDGVELVDVYVTSDNALIAIGVIWDETTYEPRNAFYESSDGRTWTPAQLEGVPNLGHRPSVTAGPRGYAAIGFELPDDPRNGATVGLWHSADGRRWERAWWPESGADGPLEQASSVDAGDEGFVALVRSTFADGAARVIASADGRTWIDGATPTSGAAHVASRHGDWILADFAELEDQATGQTVTTWFSANGLAWDPLGENRLGTRDIGQPCPEAVGGLHSAGSYIVMRTVLSWGCGEGAIYHPGAAYISGDGADWKLLPLATSSAVEGVAIVDGRLVVLADAGTGTSSGGLAIWVAPIP